MSCSTPAPKDFIKIEKYDHSHASDHIIFDKIRAHDHEQDSINNSYDHHQKEVSQSVGLFRKYLFPKAQHDIGNTKEEECSRVITRTSCIPLIPPKLGHTSRPCSFLEKRLLSAMKPDVMLSPTSSGEKSSTAQLTIFYSGAVSVYDNVSTDQAKAIMLLASGSSKSAPTVTNTTKVDEAKSHHDQRLILPSLCKLQAADIPLARRNSLRRFMDKRRGRITSKSPYITPSSSSTSQHHVEDDNGGSNGEKSLTHSPFPAQLGSFCPNSANN